MADKNGNLGQQVHEHLVKLGIETPMQNDTTLRYTQTYDQEISIQDCVTNILRQLGMDLTDDSLKDTPRRVAKMFCHEVFEGLDYANFPKCTTVENKFKYDEIVIVRNNVIRSTCEHHLQPIYGKAHIAYIPGRKVLGLSKFARVADFFASRPQVQERLTEQVYAALSYILDTEDVAVVIEAEHFCMKMRGVEEYCSDTVTSKVGGRFRSDANARRELLSLIGNGGSNG